MLAFYLSLVDSEEDKSLIEKLYNEHRQSMYKAAFVILHNQTDAEDAVRDAFLRIISNISKFKTYSCKENAFYAVMIVKGIALNMLKKKKKEVDIKDEHPDSLVLEDTVENRIQYKELLEKVKDLTPMLKTVASLHFIEGLSASEISELLGLKPDSVYSSVSRARKILLSENGGKEQER